jgi:hypothetical protein
MLSTHKRTLKFLFAFFFISLVILTLTSNPPPSANAASNSSLPENWLDRLNYYRQVAGLPPVVESSVYSTDLAKHVNYMLLNIPAEGLWHGETTGRPGYTPEGNQAAAESNLYWWPSRFNGDQTPAMAIDGWMQSIHHRYGMLNPDLVLSGFSLGCNTNSCGAGINVIRGISWNTNPRPNGIVYPGVNQTGVNTDITITWQFHSAPTAILINASLKDSCRRPIAITTTTPASGDYFNMVSIDPISKLDSYTTYTADLTVQVGDSQIHQTWQFTTDIDSEASFYTISGNAGMGGVTISYMCESTISDENGSYSLFVPKGWTGTVTPSKTGYTFTPPSLSYFNVLANQTGQNYTTTPITYTISGNAEIPGVTLSYTDGSAKTVTSDGNGNYSISVSYNSSGTVTPSHPCYTFSPPSINYSNVKANQASQNYSVTVKPGAGCTDIAVNIGSTSPVTKTYWVAPHNSARPSFTAANNGPVQISQATTDLVASQRVIYSGWSYSEMMGLPAEQLSKEYLFPYYNNVAMDSQLRVSNVGGASTTITVYLGMNQIDQYSLAAGGATRKSYTGKNSGPLRVTSSASNILATTRVLYNKNSYSELMGLPVEQLAKEYIFPWYNNVAMDSQLRVSNVGGASTTIKVYLGSSTTPIDSYTLAAGGATRKNYANRNSGPLRVTSSASTILTTVRVLYGGSSYSELMGFPTGQLGQEYWYPVYDNANVDSQLRVSNVGSATTHITVYAGTKQIDSYDLGKGAVTRKNYPKNTGPLHVVSSTQPILTTIRTLYGGGSYYEMTGLPEGQISTQYFFPWYNNTAMSSELRIAIP